MSEQINQEVIKVKVLIIGTGPAGQSAAIYANGALADNTDKSIKKIITLAGPQPGGLLTTTTVVENYPGFHSITGEELTNKFMEHASHHTEIKYEIVTKITNDKKVYTNENTYQAEAIIIASGSSPKKLGNEFNFLNRGVSYCAICDGFLYKGMDVAVVGGGNSALEEAIYLANICTKVYLIHRRNEFRAFVYLQERLKNYSNIELVLNEEIEEFIGNDQDGLTELKLKNKTIKVKGCFIAIGYKPNSDFVKDILELNDGYVVVNKDYSTSVKGIYACGDVIIHDLISRYKQAVVSAAEGCVAGLKAVEYIQSH
jgi:thioredoxin-disulfide reductase